MSQFCQVCEGQGRREKAVVNLGESWALVEGPVSGGAVQPEAVQTADVLLCAVCAKDKADKAAVRHAARASMGVATAGRLIPLTGEARAAALGFDE